MTQIAAAVSNCFDGDPSRERHVLSAPFPLSGKVRLKLIIGDPERGIPPYINVSRSTWWAGCATGRFPKPTYPYGANLPMWDAEEIRAVAEKRVPQPEQGNNGHRLVKARTDRRKEAA